MAYSRCFSFLLGIVSRPKRNEKQLLCQIWRGGGGGQTRCIMGNVQNANKYGGGPGQFETS